MRPCALKRAGGFGLGWWCGWWGGGAFRCTNQPTKVGQVSMQRGPLPPFRLGFRSGALPIWAYCQVPVWFRSACLSCPEWGAAGWPWPWPEGLTGSDRGVWVGIGLPLATLSATAGHLTHGVRLVRVRSSGSRGGSWCVHPRPVHSFPRPVNSSPRFVHSFPRPVGSCVINASSSLPSAFLVD